MNADATGTFPNGHAQIMVGGAIPSYLLIATGVGVLHEYVPCLMYTHAHTCFSSVIVCCIISLWYGFDLGSAFAGMIRFD